MSSAIGSGPGVVAVDGSSVVGFMVAPLPKLPGPDSVRLGAAHHAAQPAYARPVYRRMYGAIAGKLVAYGCTHHSLPVPLHMPKAVDTFFELEFGVDQINGALVVGDTEVSSPPSVREVRVATRGDLDELIRLSIELVKFHSGTPMFQPALLDVPSIRDNLVRSIDDDASTVVVVEDGDRLMAMMQAEPDRSYVDSVVIGMNVVTESARSAGLGTAMLAELISWAAGRSYKYCTVSWTSSNLISDAFYRGRGFMPVRYRLHRRIDPRVSWAHAALDYSFHLPRSNY